jgi:hypothetical protein
MSVRDVKFATLALLAAGCASTPGPSGYLQPAAVAQQESYGAWIDVYLENDRAEVNGELIAVESDTVFVLNRDGLHAVPRATINAARLGTYDSEWENVAYWVTGGTLLTASHGWYAAISAPIWIISGIIGAASVSRGPIEDVKGNNTRRWREVSKFARFPQGMPRDIDRTALTLSRARYGRS